MPNATLENYISPRVNVLERDDRITIEAELPGVAKQDAGVEVKEGVLTLKGVRAVPDNGSTMKLRERSDAGYYREFRLGDVIDREHVEAEMDNGVLTVTLPKVEKQKKKTIMIN